MSKVKKVKIPIGNVDGMADMFNNMIGAGDINITIAYPRYRRLADLHAKLVAVWKMVAECSFIAQPKYSAVREEIVEFVGLQEEATTMFGCDLSAFSWDWTTLDEHSREQFAAAYDAAKKSPAMAKWVLACDKLVPYRKHYSAIETFNHKFALNIPGHSWTPFPWTSLDMKSILSADHKNVIMFFMSVLNKTYSLGYAIYEELQSPDVDVDQFVEFILSAIDDIQKRPELSRCRDAFAKIRESVALLKTRFNSYYREFAETKDNTIMMQNFIIDVSQTTGASAKLTGQFHTIIRYFRKISGGQSMDPKMSEVLDKFSNHFSANSAEIPNLVNPQDDESSDDSSDSSVESTTDAGSANTSSTTPADVPDRSVDDWVNFIEGNGK